MISVVASIRIAKGRGAEFLEIFNDKLHKVRQESGCLEYFPAVGICAELTAQRLDENVVTIIEKWQNLAALRAHLCSPHMLEYKEKVRDLVEDVSLKVLQQA